MCRHSRTPGSPESTAQRPSASENVRGSRCPMGGRERSGGRDGPLGPRPGLVVGPQTTAVGATQEVGAPLGLPPAVVTPVLDGRAGPVDLGRGSPSRPPTHSDGVSPSLFGVRGTTRKGFGSADQGSSSGQEGPSHPSEGSSGSRHPPSGPPEGGHGSLSGTGTSRDGSTHAPGRDESDGKSLDARGPQGRVPGAGSSPDLLDASLCRPYPPRP